LANLLFPALIAPLILRRFMTLHLIAATSRLGLTSVENLMFPFVSNGVPHNLQGAFKRTLKEPHARGDLAEEGEGSDRAAHNRLLRQNGNAIYGTFSSEKGWSIQ
jgi:hypothetical protein